MSFDPKYALLTTAYMATKVQEQHMSLDAFIEKSKKASPEMAPLILSMELEILSRIQFHFPVLDPFLPLYGIYLELMKLHATNQEDLAEIVKIYGAAKKSVEQSLLTDLCFLYEPSHIAFACFRKEARELEKESLFDSFFQSKTFGNKSMEDLRNHLPEIEKTLDSSSKTIDITKNDLAKKLKTCFNPASNPQSEYSKYIQGLKEKEEAEKSKRKALAREEKEREKSKDDEQESTLKRKSPDDDDDDFVLNTRGTDMKI